MTPHVALPGYLDIWSAVKRYREQTGDDPLPALAAELTDIRGPVEQVREVAWPPSLRCGYQEQSSNGTIAP